MKKSMQLMVLTLGALALSGCATVKPWERDTLTDYTMRPDRDPLGSLLAEHMWFSREAASGGRSVGGGGCGCN
ncbi:MAG TPA: DUF4266 domain-containing protein [Verrucomicrobiota bacterium]|nr:DUF4266 domain-containing protein [Verrucomicrobiota bacterium]|tara:strand:- start:10 stop:228 length:219 start_codon:yes stop_codon:yes gene_type:complete